MKQRILRSMLLIVLTVISGCSGPRPSQETQPPITEERPTVTSAPTEVITQAITEAITEVPTENPTDASTEVATEAPTVASTEVATEAPTVAPTETPTQKATETPTVAPTVAPTETPTQEYCYGICIKDTEIESKGRVFFLHAGQKVAIINLYENNLEIQWYGDSAWVKADAIDILDENFIPDFASGQWAGAISKR